MKNAIFQSAILFLTFSIVGTAFGQMADEDWQQIVVMKSKKQDVERILGEPRPGINSSDFMSFYSAKNGGVTVFYSLGLCEPGERAGWNFEKGIVTELDFFPYRFLPFKSLKIDRKKFKKALVGDTDDVGYRNEADGIEYIVREGKVVMISYFPGTRFSQLECEAINKLPPLKENNDPSDVTDIHLNVSELTKRCAEDAGQNSCGDSSMLVAVQIYVNNLSDRDILSYVYGVSGGKIVGVGEKVTWDLSGVEPGTYKITVGVGKGPWVKSGKSMTKTVIVRACPNCKPESK
jgi:hypothetical protein